MNKDQYWKKIIDDCRASGLTQKTFCKNNNIKIHTFHYWLKKLNQEPETKGEFIAFQAAELKSTVDIKLGHVVITLNSSEVGSVLLDLDQAGLLYDPA